MPGMPGMGAAGLGGGRAVLVLAEIGLFWAIAVVHLLRLLAGSGLPDADPPIDLGHAVMAAGMVVMVFPGAPESLMRALAAGFAVLAVFYLLRGSRPRPGHRLQTEAVGAGQGAMAVMLADGGHPGAAVTLPVVLVLLACAVVHLRRLSEAHHLPAADAAGGRGRTRVLVTVPHGGALAMTLAMAAMFAVA